MYPIKRSFKNTFVYDNLSLSICNISSTPDENNNLNKFSEFVPDVIFAKTEIFLRKPTFPPSGVSSGHIIPKDDKCNECGARTLALFDKGVFTRRICEIAPK